MKITFEKSLSMRLDRTIVRRRDPLVFQAIATAFLIIIVVSFAGCGVNQTLAFSINGSGEAGLELELKPVFVRYLLDLSEAVSAEGADKEQIFRLGEIKDSLLGRPGVSIVKMVSTSQEKLSLRFGFKDIRKLAESVSEAGRKDILTFREKNGTRQLDFHLDRHNFSQLVSLFPFLKNPVFASLSPQEDEEITESEYLDIITFALGEGGPAAVKASNIRISVSVNGTIVSQSGGEVKGGTVIFTVPLIKVLLLSRPLDYSITFR